MAVRRRYSVMTLTDRAAERARSLIENAQRPVLGLRIGVEKGGCAGMSYTVAYADEAHPLDEIVEEKGVKLFIDSKALMFLLGTELDFETTKVAATFTFHNPNQVSACGCGESVELRPAEPAPADA